jgi:large subunit ribosomal protein LP2
LIRVDQLNDTKLSYNQQRFKMSEVAAFLLCKLGGKAGSTDDIKAVLEAGGVNVNEANVSTLTGDMEGKDINEVLAAGMEKLKNVPMGGGGGGGR